MLILDTDLASAFGKASKIEQLAEHVSNNLLISKTVYEELQVPLKYGFDFPKEVFKFCNILFPQEQEIDYYLSLKDKYPIGKSELESIAIAKFRNIAFLSFDGKAIETAFAEKIKVITPGGLFLFLKRSIGGNIYKLIDDIEEKDNRDLSFIRRIIKAGE